MEPVLVVSPHYDDAVLSVGAFMVGAPGWCTVATVMGGRPDHPVSTQYDRDSGWPNAHAAVDGRRAENRRALGALRQVGRDGPFLDGQYRDALGIVVPHSELVRDVTTWIEQTATAIGAARIVGPCGVAHPDHIAVGGAMENVAVDHPEWRVFMYEELPYRVVEPGGMVDRTRALARTHRASLTFIGDGAPTRKVAAVRCYKSQLWALDERALGVPERVWGINGATW